MPRARGILKSLLLIVLSLVLALPALSPQVARAKEPANKVVRVGWYDSSYNNVDGFGRRSGYAYEYQLKLAAYTGWSYEYVNGSWSELLQMLVDGKIDLMSDVSYTEDRAQNMLYPELPMGSEEYFLFVALDNKEISSSNLSALNGKRVGSNKDSIQTRFYREWAQRNGIESEVAELVTSEDESLQMLADGKLDAYVTVDSFVDANRAMPVCKVGYSDYFFAVNKNRPDLLEELNSAMSAIQSENPHFNQQMYEQYINTAGTNAFLSAGEIDWLGEHGRIRVGYQDNYLAFCATDKASDQLTGALKDYLEYAQTCMANAELSFEPVAFPTAEAALGALARGEVDCAFPSSLGGYDGERRGIAELNKRAYVDALTHVRNKGAYSTFLEGLQEGIDKAEDRVAFAVGMFDCDNLKVINDKYGHEKGDIYLKAACSLICHVFQHSPVFRIGGDEFCVILQNEDLRNKDALAKQFGDAMAETNAKAANEWEQVHVAMGIAVYNAQTDHNVNDVARRADKRMYENKRIRKMGR